MSDTKYSVQLMAKENLTTAGDLLHTCKLALPINRLLIKEWPNPNVQKPMYYGAISGSFESPDVEVYKAVDEVTNKLIGFIGFTRKRPQATEPHGATATKAPSTPPGLNTQVFEAVASTDMAFRSAIGNIDYYELIYIAVDARHRRRGVASRLLEQVLQQAKADEIPIITASEPEACPFFTARGFQETGRAAEWDLAQWAPPKSGFGIFRFAQMIWKPSKEIVE